MSFLGIHLLLRRRKKFMKLNDFVKKPRNTKPIKPQTQFVLQNDAAIRKYQDQINELDIQLGYYRTIEAERDNAVSKLTLEKEKTTEAQDEVNRLNTAVTDLNATIDYQAKQLEQIPALIEQTKTAQGDFSSLNNSYQSLQVTTAKQKSDITNKNNQINSLQAENKALTAETTQATSLQISAEEEFKSIREKYEEIKSFTERASKIIQDLKLELSSSKDTANYWEVEAKELQVQINEAAHLEIKLREWLNKLELQDSQSTASSNAIQNRVKDLQKVIGDMDNTMKSLRDELSYVRQINSEYRKELMRPRFMSEGAIAHREKFVIPQGKENLRTKYLGTGQPTLLKFKEPEEDTNGG